MKLHLLRHAQTQSNSASGLDFDRELDPEGLEQLQEFKSFFAAHPFEVGLVLCSSAMRTRQTWAAIAELFPGASIVFEDDLYLASSDEMLKIINAQKSKADMLVIGHNEGISVLGFDLTNDFLLLQTAGYAAIQFDFEHSGYISRRTGTTLEKFRVKG